MKSLEGGVITTLRIRKPDGFYVVAFCPICDKAEESRGRDNVNRHTLNASVEKIREHMDRKHRSKVAVR